jgi:hypothetical protein
MTVTDLERAADAAVAAGDFSAARDALQALVAEQPEAFDAWIKLAAMLRATGRPADSLAAIERSLTLRPRDFSALLMRAMYFHQTGDADRAGEGFGRALANAPEKLPDQMERVLTLARDSYQSWQRRHADVLRDAVRAVGPLTPRLDRLITNAIHLTEQDREGPSHYCYPDLPEIPFHDDRSRFPWMSVFESAIDDIQREFETVLNAEAAKLVPYVNYPETVPVDQWAALNHNRDWTAIHLTARGETIPENARHCPVTMELLKSVPQPDVRGVGPNAMFSLLAPNTSIPPHTGVTNTRLLCHLPMIVPEGCWFRVGDETRFWERGKAWVFDDSVEHEAVNPSDRLRVIMIFDMWHPDLTPEEQAGIAAVIKAGGQQVHSL